MSSLFIFQIYSRGRRDRSFGCIVAEQIHRHFWSVAPFISSSFVGGENGTHQDLQTDRRVSLFSAHRIKGSRRSLEWNPQSCGKLLNALAAAAMNSKHAGT